MQWSPVTEEGSLGKNRALGPTGGSLREWLRVPKTEGHCVPADFNRAVLTSEWRQAESESGGRTTVKTVGVAHGCDPRLVGDPRDGHGGGSATTKGSEHFVGWNSTIYCQCVGSCWNFRAGV